METMSVDEVLQGYVTRGLLRNFEASRGGGDYAFTWLSHKPMRLRWTPSTQTIAFKDLAPNMPARSNIYRELRTFLKERTEEDLPPHRRVDPAHFELLCSNRNASVSVGLRVTGGTEEEAMRKLMLLIHEAFLFLNDRWPEYMQEEFGASPE
jgi:hypothetical protein